VSSKLAVITGAGRGIGAAIARALAEHGWELLLLARSEEALSRVAGYIQAEGGKAHFLSVDLAKDTELDSVTKAASSFKRPLSLLVHNAGQARTGSLESFSLKDWQEQLDINLTAPFGLTQRLTPLMSEGSQIHFINSTAGKNVFPEWGGYCVSKFGLRALADTLREELAPKNIRVVSIFPSSVDTPLHDSLPYNWDRSHMLKPRDVAGAVIYCIKQPPGVRINEIDLENSGGKF